MIYGSVCSGIEAASVAWHPLGWKPAFFSEIDKFPREVLAHHYPHVPLHGDFTTIQKGDYESIQLLVGGTPCQSFSVAGLRAGLADPRGNLMLEFGALAQRLQPKWLLWENVPGVLSSNGGRDFGSFLAMLAELGYGFAYRVLDAQYFGVPQRRRRVFVVGCFGDWRSAAAVLFERHSLQGHPAPSRETRQEVTELAGTLAANGGGLNRPAGNANELDFCIASYTPSSFANYTEGVGTLKANGGDLGGGSESIITTFDRQAQSEYGTDAVASSVMARDYKSPSDLVTYALAENTIGRQPHNGGNGDRFSEDLSYTLNATGVHGVAYGVDTYSGTIQGDIATTLTADMAGPTHSGPKIMQSMQVRRLTPCECERLQGFPDNYTRLSDKTADGNRYKALGNSMAVPVMRWLGERIAMVDAIKPQAAANNNKKGTAANAA